MNAFVVAALVGLFPSGGPVKARAVVKPAGIKVGVVFDAGVRADRGFNAVVNDGLMRATVELGVQATVVDGLDAAGRANALKSLASQKMDLVVAVGLLFTDELLQLARAMPEQRFACLDCVPPKDATVPANALLLSFKDDEAGFLAGSVAAWQSKSGKVGFVGGMKSPQLQRFEDGFRAGAKKARADVVVTSEYAGNGPEAFINPAAGRTLAEAMYTAGNDVIFHAAGATGLGVFEAAKAKNGFVVGVDTDQDAEAPGKVLCSVQKALDVALFDVIKSVAGKTFAGGARQLGVAQGALRTTVGKTSPLDANVKQKLSALEAELKAAH